MPATKTTKRRRSESDKAIVLFPIKSGTDDVIARIPELKICMCGNDEMNGNHKFDTSTSTMNRLGISKGYEKAIEKAMSLYGFDSRSMLYRAIIRAFVDYLDSTDPDKLSYAKKTGVPTAIRYETNPSIERAFKTGSHHHQVALRFISERLRNNTASANGNVPDSNVSDSASVGGEALGFTTVVIKKQLINDITRLNGHPFISTDGNLLYAPDFTKAWGKTSLSQEYDLFREFYDDRVLKNDDRISVWIQNDICTRIEKIIDKGRFPNVGRTEAFRAMIESFLCSQFNLGEYPYAEELRIIDTAIAAS